MQRKWRRYWERGRAYFMKYRSIAKKDNVMKLTIRLSSKIVPPVAAASILLATMTGAYATPTGGQITTGAGTITQSGSTMIINQTTNKLGINWQSFSIGSGERVQFLQPGTSSIALNRVTGGNASAIYGTLSATGKVFLINPNGILFAPGAQVSAGGLVASTLNISDRDFMAGRYTFSGNGGLVMNQGNITANDGGYVALLASQVKNEGVIVARQGTIALGAGSAVTLDMCGDGLLNLAVNQGNLQSLAENKNLIQADGGQVIMTTRTADALAGTVVNNTGMIQARSVSNINGVIRLDGGSNGKTVNSGSLDVSGKGAGQGGNIYITGDNIEFSPGSRVDASGLLSGGTVTASGNSVFQQGQIDASGTQGGLIKLSAEQSIIQTGSLNVSGTDQRGGAIKLTAGNRIIQTASTSLSAHSENAVGGKIELTAGEDGGVFTSATIGARGKTGGYVQITGGRDITLNAATVDVSGAAGGGAILIGGDFQGSNLAIQNAETTEVNHSTVIRADARISGNGGKVIIWSDENTSFSGEITARGGSQSGNGGFLEVSSKENLNFNGKTNTSAPQGAAGSLLLDPKNITITDTVAGIPQVQLVDPYPNAGGTFGNTVVALSNGSIVVTDPSDSAGGSNAGAVYTFNPSSGALLTTLIGSKTNDKISSGGITVLPNGNYVILSPNWNWAYGAATFALKDVGVSGVVSNGNSLVGSRSGDQVGYLAPTILSNGNYLVQSPYWNGQLGAVTWASGTTGITGTVSGTNSLIGSAGGDQTGMYVYPLQANGNFIVNTYPYNSYQGMVTWGRGDGTTTGSITANRSYAGLGAFSARYLANGNYLLWNSGTGRLMSFDGTTGIMDGEMTGISSTWRVTPLSDGNYSLLNRDTGNVYWFNGATAIPGSLGTVLTTGGNNITALSDGNYLVTKADKVTWMPAGGGAEKDVVDGTGTSASSTRITVLKDNSYVVSSPAWNGGLGAVTWVPAQPPVSPITVSSATSLVGVSTSDAIGSGSIIALTGNRFALVQSGWDGGKGAVFFGNGASTVGTANTANAIKGLATADGIGSGLVTALANGNYVISSPNIGTVTWVNGANGQAGSSITGAGTSSSYPTITALADGNFVVKSTSGGKDYYTFGNGTTGTSAVVSSSNSLVVPNSSTLVSTAIGTTSAPTGVSQFLVRSPSTQQVTFGVPIFGNNYSGSTWAKFNLGLSSSTLLNAVKTSNVTLQANNDITVDSQVGDSSTSWSGYTLTLRAGRSININADIKTSSGNVELFANDSPLTGVIAGERDAGTARINMAPGTKIDVGAGSIDIRLQNGSGLLDSTSGNIQLGSLTGHTIKAVNEGITNNSNLILNSNALLTASGAGDAVILAARNGNFVNNSGVSAISLTGGGRWLIYSANPSGNMFGGLVSGNNAIWGTNYAASNLIGQSGNRYLFTYAPTLTFTSASLAKTYGDDATASVATAYTVTGLQTNTYGGVFVADTEATAFSGTPTVTSQGAAATADVSGTPYAVEVNTSTVTALNGYTTALPISSGRLTITPATLTIDGTYSGKRIYGEANSTITYTGTLSGKKFDDNVFLAGSVNAGITDRSDANIYSDALSTTLVGSKAQNYILAPTKGDLTINPKNITVTAVNASKVYGDANPSSGAVSVAPGSLVGTDALGSASLATSATATSSVGTYNLTPSGVTFTSGSASNYNITYADGTLSITPRSLVVTATGQNKVYDGTTAATVALVDNRIGGDTLIVTARAAFSDKNVGVSKAVNVSDISISGLDASNYVLHNPATNTTADITAKALIITANDATKRSGTSNPPFSATYSGFVGGDTFASLGGTLTFTTPATTTSRQGSYPIIPSGASSNNYMISYVNGTLTVTRPLDTYIGAVLTADQTVSSRDNFGYFGTTPFGLMGGKNVLPLTISSDGVNLGNPQLLHSRDSSDNRN